MSTRIVEITTKYEPHPTTGGGGYRATAHGRTKRTGVDHSLSSDANHEAAARALFARLLGVFFLDVERGADVEFTETWSSDDGQTRKWLVSKPAPGSDCSGCLNRSIHVVTARCAP